MKKMVSLLFLICLVWVIPVSAAETPDKMAERLRKTTIEGHTYKSHVLAQMNGTKTKEVFTLYQEAVPNNQMIRNYLVTVHEFKGGKWQLAFKQAWPEKMAMEILTLGKMGAADFVVLGEHYGTDDYVTTNHIYGAADGKRIKLLDSLAGYYFGNAKIDKGTLYLMNTSVVMSKFQFKNGKLAFVGEGTGKDDRLVAKNPKYWIGIKQHGNLYALVAKPTITMKVGETIGVGRASLTERTRYAYQISRLKPNAAVVWDASLPGFVAKSKGTETIRFWLHPEMEAIPVNIVVK